MYKTANMNMKCAKVFSFRGGLEVEVVCRIMLMWCMTSFTDEQKNPTECTTMLNIDELISTIWLDPSSYWVAQPSPHSIDGNIWSSLLRSAAMSDRSSLCASARRRVQLGRLTRGWRTTQSSANASCGCAVFSEHRRTERPLCDGPETLLTVTWVVYE